MTPIVSFDLLQKIATIAPFEFKLTFKTNFYIKKSLMWIIVKFPTLSFSTKSRQN